MAHIFDRITIIGLGLIGSSIARCAHERKLAGTITGSDLNEVSLAYARKGGFIDVAMYDPLVAVSESNLVILATPLSTLAEITKTIAPNLRPGMIVMDVASVKQPAMDAITPHLPEGVIFIPAHPIAGSEHSGISAGRSDLFERKRIIVTPAEPVQDKNLQDINSFWQGMGARVEAMPAHLHDMVYAYVSHLPQLLAFAATKPLGDYASGENKPELLQKFLRLSDSSPDLWADIFLLNKENVLKSLDRYLDVLTHITGELEEAPEDSPSENDELQARIALFPRIASSCLVTTVLEAEKQAGFSFARYAGNGFADFTFPASQPPEEDIERISAQYQIVAAILGEYVKQLINLRAAIDSGNAKKLKKALTQR